MPRRDLVLAFLILLLAAGVVQPTLDAQSRSWGHWLGEARQLAAGNQPEAAEEAFQAALKLAESEPEGALAVATVLGGIGKFYHGQKRYKEAEKSLKRAVNLAAADASFPIGSRVALRVALAGVYLDQHKGKDAEQQLLTARDVLREHLGRNDHPALVGTLVALGIARQQQREIEDAESAYRGALTILKKEDPERDLSAETAFRLLTSAYDARYRALGEANNLEPSWRKVTLMDQLARAHAEYGNGSTSIALADKALKMREALSGARSLAVAQGHGTLAAAYRRAKEFDKAAASLQQALSITSEHHRLGEFPTVWILSDLSRVAEDAGDLAEAAKWNRKGLAIIGAEYEPGHPYYVKCLESAVEAMEKLGHEEARSEFARPLEENRRAALANPAYMSTEEGLVLPTLTKKVQPKFSSESRSLKYGAQVVLLVDVDPNGKPQNIKLYRAAGHGLDGRAVDAVKKWRFNPGRLNGEPVLVTATIEVNFQFGQTKGPRPQNR